MNTARAQYHYSTVILKPAQLVVRRSSPFAAAQVQGDGLRRGWRGLKNLLTAKPRGSLVNLAVEETIRPLRRAQGDEFVVESRWSLPILALRETLRMAHHATLLKHGLRVTGPLYFHVAIESEKI